MVILEVSVSVVSCCDLGLNVPRHVILVKYQTYDMIRFAPLIIVETREGVAAELFLGRKPLLGRFQSRADALGLDEAEPAATAPALPCITSITPLRRARLPAPWRRQVDWL